MTQQRVREKTAVKPRKTNVGRKTNKYRCWMERRTVYETASKRNDQRRTTIVQKITVHRVSCSLSEKNHFYSILVLVHR